MENNLISIECASNINLLEELKLTRWQNTEYWLVEAGRNKREINNYFKTNKAFFFSDIEHNFS